MNNKRRRDIRIIIEELGIMQMQLDYVIVAEREACGNMPESIQNSEQGKRMKKWIDSLCNVGAILVNARETLVNALENIN